MNLPGIFDVVVPFVLLLGVLVFIHELGHFAVAKWLGVKVEKFSIGFGPSLFTRTVGETEYVLAALPLGGFVKMLGEIPGETLAPDELARAFNHRPVWQRIAIALADLDAREIAVRGLRREHAVKVASLEERRSGLGRRLAEVEDRAGRRVAAELEQRARERRETLNRLDEATEQATRGVPL